MISKHEQNTQNTASDTGTDDGDSAVDTDTNITTLKHLPTSASLKHDWIMASSCLSVCPLEKLFGTRKRTSIKLYINTLPLETLYF
jgi:hypothetical protein